MLTKHEKNFIIRQWRGKVESKTKKYTTLNNFYEKANALRFDKLYRDAASNYLNAILIDRKSAESYFGLGICYKNLNEYNKAIKYLEEAAKLKDNYFEAYFELGICHQIIGENCGAIKNFIRAIQTDPDNPEAILQLGISHELCEEFDLAMMIYQKLIDNSPEFSKAYEHKSSLLMKLGKYKEAAIILTKLLKLYPDYSKAYAGIGVCFEKLNQTARAQRYYRKFLLLNTISEQNEFIKDKLQKNSKIPVTNLKIL